MTRKCAADDFATIRARMDELRRERETAAAEDAASGADPAEAERERRHRERREGLPPPWVPTIFLSGPLSGQNSAN